MGIKEVTESPVIEDPRADSAEVSRLLRSVRFNSQVWEKYFVEMTAEEVIARTSRGGTVTIPVNTVAQVLNHPQRQTYGMVQEVEARPWMQSNT